MSTDSGTEASCQRRDKGPVVGGPSSGRRLHYLRAFAGIGFVRLVRRRRFCRTAVAIVPTVAVATGREYGLFINGELTESASGQTRDLKEPATDEPLATVAVASEQDVDRAVEAARSALDGPWGKTPPNERSRLLHALADALVANRKELAELEVRTSGRRSPRSKPSSRKRSRTSVSTARPSARSPAARIRSAGRSSSIRSRSPSASPDRSCPGTTR